MKKLWIQLSMTEISYLLILLEGEKESGEYWGNKEQHYKRRDALYDKLADLQNEHKGKN